MLELSGHLLLGHVHSVSHLFCHLGEPLQGLLNRRNSHDVEAMEDLGVDAGFFEDSLWDLAVLTWCPFDQINDIVDATVFESELLLLVTAVHDGSCKIICCLSLNYEIKDVVSKLRYLFEFLRCSLGLLGLRFLLRPDIFILLVRVRIVYLGQLILVWLVIEDILVILDSQDPYEVSQRKRSQLCLDSARLESIVEVVDVLVVPLLSVVHNQHYLNVFRVVDTSCCGSVRALVLLAFWFDFEFHIF